MLTGAKGPDQNATVASYECDRDQIELINESSDVPLAVRKSGPCTAAACEATVTSTCVAPEARSVAMATDCWGGGTRRGTLAG